MKKFGVLEIILVILVVIVVTLVSKYNGLVSRREAVDGAYANLDVTLQRRCDLIPNLVSTVKGFASHETETIDKVIDARTKLINANTIDEKSEANDELTSSLNALLVVVENYPDLKSSANFTQLADELAGTENRIAVARRNYNNAVRTYNTYIGKFPSNIIANMFDFETSKYFEASDNASDVPQVSFD